MPLPHHHFAAFLKASQISCGAQSSITLLSLGQGKWRCMCLAHATLTHRVPCIVPFVRCAICVVLFYASSLCNAGQDGKHDGMVACTTCMRHMHHRYVSHCTRITSHNGITACTTGMHHSHHRHQACMWQARWHASHDIFP